MANKKMTKRDYFNELLTIVEVQDNKAMVEFINHELELLEKKNASKSSTETKTQKENAGIKENLLNEMEQGKRYTISDMLKELPCCKELTNQKVSALVRQLIAEDKVVRIEEKRKAYFSKV
jgi:hypothetical protein